MSHALKLEPEAEAALLAAYGANEPPLAEAKRRDRTEKRMAANPQDGRRLRATGRTAQFNVNMKPDVKAGIAQAARRAGVSVTVWIERVVLAAMAAESKGGKHA